MHPNNYFSLFPAFPRENKIFVAMSFAPQYHSRWKNVIAPAIQNISINNINLQPHRVDTSKISDSILTEILGGISNDFLVFCDITSMGLLDDRPIRNGNVMYELGLAHAVRLPEEVLLFRSDTDNLLFDMANIRVNTYSPEENPGPARELIVEAISEAVHELDFKKHSAVKSVADSLDYISWEVLLNACVNKEGIHQYKSQTMAQVVSNASRNNSISKLLQLGVLSTEYVKVSLDFINANPNESFEHLFKYFPTSFGNAVFEYSLGKLNIQSIVESSPDFFRSLEDNP